MFDWVGVDGRQTDGGRPLVVLLVDSLVQVRPMKQTATECMCNFFFFFFTYLYFIIKLLIHFNIYLLFYFIYLLLISLAYELGL